MAQADEQTMICWGNTTTPLAKYSRCSFTANGVKNFTRFFVNPCYNKAKAGDRVVWSVYVSFSRYCSIAEGA